MAHTVFRTRNVRGIGSHRIGIDMSHATVVQETGTGHHDDPHGFIVQIDGQLFEISAEGHKFEDLIEEKSTPAATPAQQSQGKRN